MRILKATCLINNIAERFFQVLILVLCCCPCAQAATHTATLNITNPNTSVSATPVLNSDGALWFQVYVEIPAKLYMDKGWLNTDLSNLRFIDVNDGNIELAYWVPIKKDSNLRINNLGLWLLVKNLAANSTETIKIEMVDGVTFNCNPRAPAGSLTTDRDGTGATTGSSTWGQGSNSYCAKTVFPLYSYDLSDTTIFNKTGSWTNNNIEFIDKYLSSEDDLTTDCKSNANAVTGNEFTISILNMKFYDDAASEAMIYFHSQAHYDAPGNLDTANGYRLYLKRADDYATVADNLHYDRYHFTIKLQKNTGSGFADVATADWYPYNNYRSQFDLKVGAGQIGLYLNKKQAIFTAAAGSSVTNGKYNRADAFTNGFIGFDRRSWLNSSAQDINFIILRRFFDIEPTYRIHGNADLTLWDQGTTPETGLDIIETTPNLQQVDKTVGGNSLEDYVYSTFSLARQNQIINTYKLKLRNRGQAAETFTLNVTHDGAHNWLLYYYDPISASWSNNNTPPNNITFAAGSSITYTLKLVPTMSALFNGSTINVDIEALGQGDASWDRIRYTTRLNPQLGCFWQYKKPITISWPGGHGYTNLYNHQVLVNITGDTTLMAAARADGADIIFTDNAGNHINFWLKSFDKAAGNLQAWVNVPVISPPTATIYVWTGNSAFSTSRSNKAQTFDLWEDWENDYAVNTPIGCNDTTTACNGYGADPHGWTNIPTTLNNFNWWKLQQITYEAPIGTSHTSKMMQASIQSSIDTGPYIQKGDLGWDHYEVSYLFYMTNSSFRALFNPVYFIDAGNMWGMEFYDNKYIFRAYASGIDFHWPYQTYVTNLLPETGFPVLQHPYWVKVRVFKDKTTGETRLRIKMAKQSAPPADIDADTNFITVADFLAPPAFSLPYGKIGFGGWNGGFAFDDIRVRKYIEDPSNNEPILTYGTTQTLSPKDGITLSNPQITAPIFNGRPAYVTSLTTPYTWRGDIQVYYADCMINNICAAGEEPSQLGTISTMGNISATEAKGVGFDLMRRDPGNSNDDTGSPLNPIKPRTIYTTNGTTTDFIPFGLSHLNILGVTQNDCLTLKPFLGTSGACDPNDGIYDATEKIIRFTRGYYESTFPRSNSRNFDGVAGYDDPSDINSPKEQWKLNDVLHSNPLLIGTPNMGYEAADYWNFVNTNDARPLIAYFMANDSMLHAAKLAEWSPAAKTYQPTTSDNEIWAFIPHANLNKLSSLTGSDHSYIADGLLRAIDMKFHDSSWHTILFGLGGKDSTYFFAVDITNPSTPILLWDKTTDPSGRIGTTISAPAMGLLTINGVDTWVAVIGSGYDTDYINNFENKNAWLTMINLENGSIIKQIKVSNKTGNVLTDITPFRKPANGLLNSIYFGDYYGALWRVSGQDLVSLTHGSTLTEASHMLFKPDGYDAFNYPQDAARPITVRPAVAQGEDSTEYWVYFGTGDFNEYDADYPYQAFYGLKEQDHPYLGDLDSSIVDMTISATTNASHKSWFIKLGIWDPNEYMNNTTTGNTTVKGRNERVLRPPEIYGGFAFFTTYEPENSPCGDGISRFYSVRYNSGSLRSGLFKNIKNGAATIANVRAVELSTTGIPSMPLILESSGSGATPAAAGTVSTSSGELIKVELNESMFSSGLSFLLWREKK